MSTRGDDRLTPGNARAMNPGETLRDDVVTGLELRCGSQRRSFRLYYRTKSGVERRPSIGRWPDMNIDDARRAARDILVRVAQGEDPSADWQDMRAAPTVADLWAHYEPWLRANRAAGTHREYSRIAAVSILSHAVAAMKVRDVQLRDVEAWMADVRGRKLAPTRTRKDGKPLVHTPSKKTAPHAADRAKAVLQAMFKHAELRTAANGSPPWRARNTNPCSGTETAPGKSRDRYATPEELARIGRALRENEPVFPRHVAMLRIHLLTGARTAELGGGLWRNLSPDQSNLRIFEHKTARRTGHKDIYIPAAAREELTRLQRLPIDSRGRIFGEMAKDAPLRFLWEAVREAAGCPDLQIRDLRRTYASLIFDPSAGEAVNSRIIGSLLGHTQADTTLIYTQLFSQVKQKAAEGAADRGAGMLRGSDNNDESNHGD